MKHTFYMNPALLETLTEASSSARMKCQLNPMQTIVLGIIAAAYLSLATTLTFAVSASISSPNVQKLVMGAVFPVGLIAVVIAVSELSTGNYLITPLGAMTHCIRWKQVLYNWSTSYAGNFLGAFLLALIIIQGVHVLTGEGWGQDWVTLLIKVTATKATLSFKGAFWRGVLCIWLVNLAIWQAFRVKDFTAKFLLIWFPTFAFFSMGLEHSVVNMFLFPVAILVGAEISWVQFFVNNLVPVVMGNVVGGTFIVGMRYWFSGGLPVLSSSGHVSERGGGSFRKEMEPGHYALFMGNLLKGLATAILFFTLFPEGVAAIALLLTQSMGIAIPIGAVIYLTGLSFLLSHLWNRPEDSTD